MALGKFSKALLNEVDVSSALAGTSIANQYGLVNDAPVDNGGHNTSDFLYNSAAGPSSTPSKIPLEYDAFNDSSWVGAEKFPDWLSNESSWTFAPSDLEGGENPLMKFKILMQ